MMRKVRNNINTGSVHWEERGYANEVVLTGSYHHNNYGRPSEFLFTQGLTVAFSPLRNVAYCMLKTAQALFSRHQNSSGGPIKASCTVKSGTVSVSCAIESISRFQT